MAHFDARIGTYLITNTVGERVRAYVPRPLPPEPPLDVPKLLHRIEKANQAIGRLDGMGSVLPSPELFVYMFLRKEALLSSQIEGTQSSFSDLLLFENEEEPLVPLDDVREVSSYIGAMEYGLARLADGFPLSLRLLREIHARLLSGGRGCALNPGEFRTSQNWIGGTRPGNALFVPPPPEKVMDCLGDFEKFLHDRAYPVLLKAALAHVQFETIHPFLDGNGRLGRLLVTLMLCEQGALSRPILYLSLYLKTNRTRYYDLLQQVREKGDWETWVEFFLDGVTSTSEQAVSTARRLLELFERDHERIGAIGRSANSTLRVHGELQKSPILSVPLLARRLSLSQPTVQNAVRALQNLGIVQEATGRHWGRLYRYQDYLRILEEGTEPLRR